MAKYLITGASGFVGHALAERLTHDGHKVRALVRRTSKREELAKMGVEFAEGDVTDERSVRAAVDGVEFVVHTAGLVKAAHMEDLYRVNRDGAANVARSAADAKVKRLVVVSSGTAGGPSQGRPRKESDLDNPLTNYGKSKLAGEKAAADFADRLETVIVRPTVVYGPRDFEFLGLVFFAVKIGIVPKTGFGQRKYSLIHSTDLADLIVRAVERAKPMTVNSNGERQGLFYASDGREYLWEDFARFGGEALGKRVFVLPTPEALSWVGGVFGSVKGRLTGRAEKLNLDKMADLLGEQVFSNEKACKELGFAPQIEAARGFREAAAWFKAQGLL
jgi:dihydroflavonol-4-reductase